MLSARNLASIEADGRRIGIAARQDPDTPVPQYPDWSLRDLASHTASIHGRTILFCEQLPTERISAPRLPGGLDVLDWYDETLDRLLATLADMDPETRSWAFGPSQNLGFWETRMVIETGVHRFDAEAALGKFEPLTDHVALCGLDEFARMWMPQDTQTIEVVAEDLGRTWIYGGGDTTATVRGSGSEIYLRLMSRPSSVVLPDDWSAAMDGLSPAVKL